jgi:hypothetical protein
MLAPGDPLRTEAGRALLLSAITAGAFVLFAAATTQVSAVRAQSPWQDDPYDVVVSFTLFFVPFLLAIGVARAQLWRRAAPLPIARVAGLVRAALVGGVLIGATMLADWVALLVGADRGAWGAMTPMLVLALAGLSGLAAVSLHRSRAVDRHLSSRPHDASSAVDWASDLVPLAEIVGGHLPLFGRPFVAAARWCERWLIDGRWGIRRRPFQVMLAGSLAAGLAFASGIALREEGWSPLFPIRAAVFAGGTFAFLVLADRSLLLVEPHARSSPAAPVWAATTSGALAIPVLLAFRDVLWRVLGQGTQGVETPAELGTLLAGGFAAVWSIAYVVAAARDHVRHR